MTVKTFEDFLSLIGPFGRYQKMILCLCTGMSLFNNLQVSFFAFGFALSKHRCKLPGVPNDTYAIQSNAHFDLVNASIPKEEKFESCFYYSDSSVLNATQSPALVINEPALPVETAETSRPLLKCEQWVFDKAVFDLTIVEELELVCGKTVYRAHANMAFMIGSVAMFATTSALCDVFGRKRVLVVSVAIQVIIAFASVFFMSSSIPVMLVLRFLTGAFAMPFFYYCPLVLCLEITGNKQRNIINIIMAVAWVSGGFFLTAMSFVWRNYVDLLTAIAVPSLLFLSCFWILPESPRWLLSKARFQEARSVLETMAKMNNSTFPVAAFEELVRTEYSTDGALNSLMPEEASDERSLSAEIAGKSTPESKPEVKSALMTTSVSSKPASGVVLLLRSKKLLFRSFIVGMEWIIIGLVYYAIMFNVTNLSGSPYVNLVLLFTVDAVVNSSLFMVVDKIGRKKTYLVCLSLVVLGCFASVLPHLFMEKGPQQGLVYNILSLTGRGGAAAAFTVVILYTAELFPTPLRVTVIGGCNFLSKLASAFAPYIADLGILIGGPFAEILPLLVCGSAGLVGIVLLMYLHETNNTNLPDTVEEAMTTPGKTRDAVSSNGHPEEEEMVNKV